MVRTGSGCWMILRVDSICALPRTPQFPDRSQGRRVMVGRLPGTSTTTWGRLLRAGGVDEWRRQSETSEPTPLSHPVESWGDDESTLADFDFQPAVVAWPPLVRLVKRADSSLIAPSPSMRTQSRVGVLRSPESDRCGGTLARSCCRGATQTATAPPAARAAPAAPRRPAPALPCA